MSKFVLTLTPNDIADQTANLINSGGQLAFRLNRYSILHNNIKYVIKLHDDQVIGVMGIEKKNNLITEMKHLCVHHNYRRLGLGRKLLEFGVKCIETSHVYGCVRSDNFSNIRNNFRVGMKIVAKYRSRNCYILVFLRKKEVVDWNLNLTNMV